MRNEFIQAINQVCSERNLSQEVVIEAVEAALVSAYKRNFGPAENIRTKIDPVTGQVHVYAEKEVVEKVVDPRYQISLEEARKIRPTAEIGETVSTEATPKDFGRIAAQTAKQVILQRIREAERDVLYNTYVEREGELITGTVQSIDHQAITLNLGKTEAILPRSEQIPGERPHQNQRIKAYVVEVSKTSRGPQIIVSRTHRNMLRRLLETEVPEIFNGTVEIKAIAREAGSRSKVAVAAVQEGVDPVGSCVGMRGVRIQNIVNELNGEKIDIVEWSPDVATFIANALSPAKVMNVSLREEADGSKTASVIVPDRQLSLAIGKEGQNARLAAKLTGWRIDIKSASEAAEEALKQPEITAPLTIPSGEDLLKKAEAILMSKPVEPESYATDIAQLPLTEEEAHILAEEGVVGPEEGLGTAAALQIDGRQLDEPSEESAPLEDTLMAALGGQMPDLEEQPEAVEVAAEEEPEEEWSTEPGEEYEEEELFTSVGHFSDREDQPAGGKKKKKKDSRKRTLLFDEARGQLVSKKRRKPSRIRGWDYGDEE